MTWPIERCDWRGPEGETCGLRQGHRPMQPGIEGHAPREPRPYTYASVRYPGQKEKTK